MAYAAVTSLMETLSLHFLQSEPPFPLEDLEAQIRDANENLGLLQLILERYAIANNDAGGMKDGEVEMREMELDEAKSPSKGWRKQRLLRLKANYLPRLHGIFNQAVKRLCGKQLLTSRLREVAKVKQKIVSLHENLGLLQQSREKSEIAYDDAGVMKDLEAQIRDASFKAEERIEMELTTIYLAKGQGDSLHIVACLLRLHEIFNEAEKQTGYHRNELIRIQSEYQLIAKAASSQNERTTDVKGGLSQPYLAHKNIIVSKFSKKASKFDDSNRMVGCHKEVFMTILDQLTRQSTMRRQVVSIVGMGGIGKTTLAHKLYEHSSVTSHFDKRAWVTTSQEYNVEQMLRCLIGCVIAASRDELHEQSTGQYQERLYKCLKGQRYLIVIDDIWNTTAWDSVQRCFPDDNNGSCILLTSRLKEVAKYVSSDNSIINMPFLDVDESWSLYCQVFGKIKFPSVFEQIGRNIVKKCKGLPLAITVVASLLSQTEEVEEKWKNVAKSVTDDSNDACSGILHLSYNQLPHHLKACFLYFGNFEEDYEIPVKKLVRLWAAEGFLRAADHQNMEKVAMECLQDLIDRSLVFVSKQTYNGKMKTIRIHDLLHDLCLREARRENLLNVIGDDKLPFYKKKISCRWISATSRFHLLPLTKCSHKSHSLHSYYFVERLFSHFKLLRVVDIKRISSHGYGALYVLANLIHLRYLALRCSTDASSGYFNLELFEHLNMQSFIVRGAHVALSSSRASGIWKMPLLRNFCVERIVSLGTLSFVHRKLESISWLDSNLCTKDLFTRIPNLKKLGIDGGYDGKNLDCFYNFVHLGQLEKLSIKKWLLKYIPYSGIPWATGFLPNLKKLKFLSTMLQWSDMRVIGLLPNLEVLKLIHAIASQDRMWEPSEEGFRQLKRLVIEDRYLERWNAVGDHFPVLECLELRECKYLQEIPSGFADITTLALIQLNYCGDSFLASAKLIQEEQYNYGNALLVRSENIMTKSVKTKRKNGMRRKRVMNHEWMTA